MVRWKMGMGVLVPVALLGLSAAGFVPRQESKAETAKKAVALLKAKCVACHKPDGKLAFDATNYQSLVKKGLLKAGDPKGSMVLERIQSKDAPMPPEPAKPLTPAEQALFSKWIADGLTEPSATTAAAPKVLAQVGGGSADKGATATKALAIIKKNCGACHNGSQFFDAGNHRDMIKKGYFVGGDPDASLGLQFILGKVADRSSKQMPPEPLPTLSDSDKATVRQWILDGAQNASAAATVVAAEGTPAPTPTAAKPKVRRNVPEQELLKAIVRDLEDANERDRPYLRYYSLANLYRNPEISDEDLAGYRVALDKLINSLSWSPDLVLTKTLGPENLLQRLDLRAVDWTPELWQRIVGANPYGLLPREASAQATSIRALSGASFPYVRVDWFAATASVPPLYHEILDLPTTVDALEKKLGVDVKGNIEQEKAIRAGRRQSGVSRNNRVAERHRSLYGAYWKSYDFGGNQDRQNIFLNPVDFREDGGEFVFNLPNGLQAYFIADRQGRRLDTAPSDIVRDLDTPGKDPIVTNGLSCIGCHSQGMRTFPDQVRPHLDTILKATFDIDHAQALYKPQDVLQTAFKSDIDRFQTALKKLGTDICQPSDEPVIKLARYYLDNDGSMSVEQAAADVGLSVAEFQRRIGKSTRLETLGFGQLEAKNGGFKRDAWEQYFGDLVSETRLGDYVPPTRKIERGKSGAISATAKLTSVHIGAITCDDQHLMDRVRQNLIFWLSRSPLIKIARVSTDADAILKGQIIRKDGELTIVLTEEKRRIKEDITGLFSDLDFVTQQLADRMHGQLTGERLALQPQVTAVTAAAPTQTPQKAFTPLDPILNFTQALSTRGLSISVDRGPGGTYKFGEEVPIRIRSDRDGFLTIYNIDSTGTVSLLFPNNFVQNNQVKAGQLVTIGDLSDPFKIQAQGVPGRETVIAVLTPQGIANNLPGVAEFRQDPTGKSLSVVARGVSDFSQALGKTLGVAARTIPGGGGVTQTTFTPLPASSGVIQATVQFFTVQ